MPIRFQPILTEAYAKKIASGRQFPLVNQARYLSKAFKVDASNNVIMNANGIPAFNRLENIYFYFGMPLPSTRVTSKLHGFNQRLKELFPHKRDYFPNSPEDFHVTLLSHRWEGENIDPSPHPMFNDPREVERFLRDTARHIADIGPSTVYFKELALFDDGAIIACGYPQDFMPFMHEKTTIDLMREVFYSHWPQAGAPLDIVHTTVGRFIRELTPKEHAEIWREIDDFNRTPIGGLTLRKLHIMYETRQLLSEVKPLGEIDLMTSNLNIEQDNILSIATDRLAKETGFKDPRSLKQAISAVFGTDEGNDAIRFKKAEAILSRVFLEEGPEMLEKVRELLPGYHAWTASGAHRFMPLAVVVANLFSGTEIMDQQAARTLAEADPQFKYLTDVYPPFANPESIPEQYLPPIKKGPVIRIDAGKANYRWLDIASAPKSGGAPTLNALRQAFNLLLPGKTFELIGTDISFPYFSLLQDGSITESQFVRDGRFLEKVHDTKNDVIYLNSNNAEFDAMKGLVAIEPGSVDFLSISMALHHLYEGEYVRLPFSSLEIWDPGGRLLTDEIMLRMTKKQQEIIDGFLSKLTPGGIFFGNLSCVLFDKRSVKEYIDENNDDMLFIIQRSLSSDGFTFYGDAPVLFRPNADAYSPQTESMLIRGKHYTVEYYDHPGIASIYPDKSEEFYKSIEDLFARANKVALVYQGWKKGAWGSAAAAIEGIKQGKRLPEIIRLYLRHVPDSNPIKILVLEEAKQLEMAARS